MISLTALSCLVAVQAPAQYLIYPQVDASVTRDAQAGYKITWKSNASKVTIYSSGRPDRFPRHPLVRVENAREATVPALPEGVRTYYKLVFSTGKPLVVADRFIALEGRRISETLAAIRPPTAAIPNGESCIDPILSTFSPIKTRRFWLLNSSSRKFSTFAVTAKLR